MNLITKNLWFGRENYCRPLRSIRYYKVWNRLRYCRQWIELNRLLLKIIY